MTFGSCLSYLILSLLLLNRVLVKATPAKTVGDVAHFMKRTTTAVTARRIIQEKTAKKNVSWRDLKFCGGVFLSVNYVLI